MGDRKSGFVRAWWVVPLGMGLIGLGRVTQSPGFQGYRNVDVVQLIVSGACFGVALVGLVLMIRRVRA